MKTFEKLASVIETETGISGVTPSTKLEELNIDSLELLNLLLRIEIELAKVPEDKVSSLQTVGDIWETIDHISS